MKKVIVKSISLDLKTIEDEPSTRDLPISPSFGTYSALCKSSEINKNSTSYFTLERRAYNPMTSNYLTLEVACSYDAANPKHIGVARAIESKAIISACSELHKGDNIIHIVTTDIEWNSIYSGNKSSTSFSKQITDNNKKQRNQDIKKEI